MGENAISGSQGAVATQNQGFITKTYSTLSGIFRGMTCCFFRKTNGEMAKQNAELRRQIEELKREGGDGSAGQVMECVHDKDTSESPVEIPMAEVVESPAEEPHFDISDQLMFTCIKLCGSKEIMRSINNKDQFKKYIEELLEKRKAPLGGVSAFAHAAADEVQERQKDIERLTNAIERSDIMFEMLKHEFSS